MVAVQPREAQTPGPVRLGPSVLRIATKSAAVIAAIVLVILGSLILLLTQPYWPMLAGFLVIAGAIALGVWVARPFAIGLTAVLLIGGVLVLASQLGVSTPPISGAQGGVVPGSIATLEKVNLGGSDQWLMIRGQSTKNPVLLYLSGGPGGTQYAWNREYLSELEKHFTIVSWEQRATGKSASLFFSDFGRVTPQQYLADGLQLTNYLRQRFHQDKIYLWGQSWGTFLGIWMVQQRPEWFAAYVGVGQMTSAVNDDRLIYQYDLDKAQREGNSQLLAKLRALGPPPYHGFFNMANYATIFGPAEEDQARLVKDSGPPARPAEVGMMSGPEYGVADVVGGNLALAFTFATVYDQLDNVDLVTQASVLHAPVYLVEGRFDRNAMPQLAQQYYNALQAPTKELVWFEHSGHNAAHYEPARFVDFMVNTVLAQTRR